MDRVHSIHQQSVASAAEDFNPSAWSCGFSSKQEVNALKALEHRFLFEDGHNKDHDHSDHDRSTHNHFNHSDHFDPSNTEEVLADLQHLLRGSQLRIGKCRRVQESYSFWVDIYVEIDRDLCAGNGEGDMCDIMVSV